MTPILAIARATLPELLRQRLLLVPVIGVVLTLLLLAGALVVTDGPIELERAQAEQVAWGAGIAASLGAAVYGLIIGASLIAREIADGTLLMLAARPIGRWQIVAGRVLGAAAFLTGALVATGAVYGIVAAVVSGMAAPLDEPLVAIAVTLPGVLFALCVGTAFSIQGRATAAIGSAVAVSLFALVVSSYASQWRAEQHRRAYLVEAVQSRLGDHQPVVGRAAGALTRILPFGVFAAHAQHTFFDRFDEQLPEGSGDERVDTTRRGGYGGPVPVTPAGEPQEPERLPDMPDAEAYQCAEYGGAQCFLGYRDAWTRRYIPPPPHLHERTSVALAWLALPLWLGIAMLLLWRRRDLVE